MEIIELGKAPFQVRLEVAETEGQGISAFLTGGTAPHVGGVAVAVPRNKSNADGLTCDVSQICLPGHKDVYAAVEVAKMLALGANQPVSVTAGLHVDHASPEDVAMLLELSKAAAQQWLDQHGQFSSTLPSRS